VFQLLLKSRQRIGRRDIARKRSTADGWQLERSIRQSGVLVDQAHRRHGLANWGGVVHLKTSEFQILANDWCTDVLVISICFIGSLGSSWLRTSWSIASV